APERLQRRLAPPPRMRCRNRAVSPAVEAIVRRCLEPDPQRRYQSARDLLEDIARHQANLPLRHAPDPSLRERLSKWVRRNPVLTSPYTAAAAALLALLVLGALFVVRGRQLARAEARTKAQTTWAEFQEEARTAQFLLYTRTAEPEQLRVGAE